MADLEGTSGDFTVTITGIRKNANREVIGNVCVAIHLSTNPQKHSFPGEHADFSAIVELEDDPDNDEIMCTHTFKDIPYGELAVSCFHDTYLTGAIDLNFMGMPRDGMCLHVDSFSETLLPLLSYKDLSPRFIFF